MSFWHALVYYCKINAIHAINNNAQQRKCWLVSRQGDYVPYFFIKKIKDLKKSMEVLVKRIANQLSCFLF